jgi:PhnB protein
MTVNLNPYLSFDGNAREAMEFYRSVLGGELTINTFGEFGQTDPVAANRVMHAHLVGGLGVLMASDIAPDMTSDPGNTITVSLSGDPGEGIEDAWSKLSDDGQVTMPFEKQMWGDMFGMVVDKFGVPWMVNVSQQG